MATGVEWSLGYARQAYADFTTFEAIQDMPIPQCHQLQFLQMACEKLVKSHLCGEGANPAKLQTSHAYVAKSLPVVLRQQASYSNFRGRKAQQALKHARHLALEVDCLAPAVKRGGLRRDNCEYPWEDDTATLHVPLDWTLQPSQLIVIPAGRTVLKLIKGAIERLLQ